MVHALDPSRRWVLPVPAVSAATGRAVVVSRRHIDLTTATVVAVSLAATLIDRARGRADRTRALRRIQDQEAELATLRAAADTDQERLRQFVHASPVGLALSDEHGRMVQVNEALCQLVGLQEADLIGQSAASFTHPDDMEFLSRSGQVIHDSAQGVARVETRYVRAGGEVFWVLLTLTHVTGPAGKVWTLAHVQDITDRKDSESRLRQSHQVVEAARLVAHAVQRGEDFRQVVVDQTLAIVNASSVCFAEKVDADDLSVIASSGDPDLTGTRISLMETSMSGHVWRTGTTEFVNDTAGHPRTSPRLFAKAKARSMMWTPVLVDGAVVAILTVAWSQPVEQVTQLQRAAVDTIVAEAALAWMSESSRHSLEQWSMTDPLTGLLNRRGWESQVAAMDGHRTRDRVPTIIALLDFDHFKTFNDSRGHTAGDTALSEFGTAVNASRRTHDLVARWGGEEFAIALFGCPPAAAPAALQRIASCLPPELSCSIGYTVLKPDEDVNPAIRRADEALYAAKESGRDQVRGFEPHHGAIAVADEQPAR